MCFFKKKKALLVEANKADTDVIKKFVPLIDILLISTSNEKIKEALKEVRFDVERLSPYPDENILALDKQTITTLETVKELLLRDNYDEEEILQLLREIRVRVKEREVLKK